MRETLIHLQTFIYIVSAVYVVVGAVVATGVLIILIVASDAENGDLSGWIKLKLWLGVCLSWAFILTKKPSD